jgi:hypothetical protein
VQLEQELAEADENTEAVLKLWQAQATEVEGKLAEITLVVWAVDKSEKAMLAEVQSIVGHPLQTREQVHQLARAIGDAAEEAGLLTCLPHGQDTDTWYDRSVCSEPCNSQHTRCVECGRPVDGPCPLEAS